MIGQKRLPAALARGRAGLMLAMQAGLAAINQDPSFISAERARNKEVRDCTM